MDAFELESVTAATLDAERERERQRREITRRMAAPIKGCGQINVQPQFDLGAASDGQMDLFSPIVED